MPEAADNAWEAMGGGPADLIFPDEFEGDWQVTSTLTSVELPLGADFAVDARVVERARREDLNRPISYASRFVRNRRGQVVMDRLHNTAALMAFYYGANADFIREISWDLNNPNDLTMVLPGGGAVSSRVTRRSFTQPGPQRLETSEYLRQTFDAPTGAAATVRASQCFTKYKYRSAQEARGGPEIVATQVVSDYLTAFDDERKFMTAMGKPVTVYTYRMALFRSGTTT